MTASAVEAVAHGPDSFLWSEQEYEPRDLMEKFEDLLPFVVMVTQGYYGKDESIHMFASDEIYWLREIAHQKRIVCRDSNQEYYSIPLCYPDDVTPSQSNGIDGPKMSIKEMANKGIYRFFKFEPGCRSTTKNADHYQYKDLGTLEITETYEERFLIVHTVLSGAYREPPTQTNYRGYNNVDGILSKFTIIPLYMPIALAVAVGMSDTETENFHRTMYNFGKFVDTQPRKYDEYLKLVSDIMAFDEAPCGGDYEYIHFLQFIRANKEKQNISSDGYWSIGDVAASSPKPELPQRGSQTTVAKSETAPKRPPKPGENKKSIKGALQDLPAKIKKKTSRATKTVHKSPPKSKERAPSPVSDHGETSDDSLDYEEIPNGQQISPKHPALTFTPTPLAYREGSVALGVDVGPILEELNDILFSGVAPKSTKVKAPPPNPRKEVACVPKILPRDPIVHERIDYEQVDLEPPPRPDFGRSKSTSDQGVGVHVKSSFQQGKSQSLDSSDRHKQVTVGKTSPSAHSVSMSDVISSKQNLKRVPTTKPVTDRKDITPVEEDMQSKTETQKIIDKDSARSFTTGETLSEKPTVLKKPQSKLAVSPPNKETLHRIQGNHKLGNDTPQDRSKEAELSSILKKRAELIAAKPLTDNLNATAVGTVPEPMPREEQPLCIESGSTNVTEKSGTKPVSGRQIHGSNIAVIQPQVKVEPSFSVKPLKPNAVGQPTLQIPRKEDIEDIAALKKSKYVLKVLSDDIVSGADIPHDVSKFTVGDVARCLELLNMSDHVDDFMVQLIDGALLQSLDEKILESEFGLTGISAKKLMMFAKEGWRPNV